MLRGFLPDGVFEVSLNAAAFSGEADFGFLGRGAWIDMPRAFSASQGRRECDIEPELKRMQSLLRFDCLPATTEKGGRSWIYAHLILAILTDECSQDLQNFSP